MLRAIKMWWWVRYWKKRFRQDPASAELEAMAIETGRVRDWQKLKHKLGSKTNG